MTSNICRCGAYQRLRRAVYLAAEIQRQGKHLENPTYDHPAFIQAASPDDKSLTLSFAPNAFLRIGSDDIVTVIVNHSELGQGVYTALPMLVAEELEADWSKVRVAAAPVDPVYNHTVFGMQATGGSTSTWSEWQRLRQAGAAAKAMLLAAAAQIWQVDPADCRAENGQIIHDASGKKISYGQLAEKAAKLQPPATVTLKETKNFHLIGHPPGGLIRPVKLMARLSMALMPKSPGCSPPSLPVLPFLGAKLKASAPKKPSPLPESARWWRSSAALRW